MKVIRVLPVLESRAALDAWFTRVIVSTARDHLRRELRRLDREHRRARTSPREASELDVDGRLELEEDLARLGIELVRLTAEERELLRQRYWLGRTLEQIGQGLGLTGNSVSGRLRRLLSKLRAGVRDGLDADLL